MTSPAAAPADTYELRAGTWAARVRRYGAELVSLSAGPLGEVIWQGTSPAWSSRAPVLFPIIGRLPDGHIGYRGRPYRMPPHGFARDRSFDLVSLSENRLHLRLDSDASTLELFPYRFRLGIEFRIGQDSLELDVTVENSDAVPLPYDLGWHPTFEWPPVWCTGTPRLVVEGARHLTAHRVRAAMIEDREPAEVHAGPAFALTAQVLADGALALIDMDRSTYAYECEGGPRLIFDTSGFPNLGIWRAPDTQSICIEPWCGYPAARNGFDPARLKPGSRLLAPTAAARHRIALRVE